MQFCIISIGEVFRVVSWYDAAALESGPLFMKLHHPVYDERGCGTCNAVCLTNETDVRGQLCHIIDTLDCVVYDKAYIRVKKI